MKTLVQEINRAILDAMDDPATIVCAQGVVNKGMTSLTNGVAEKNSEQFVKYPVSESMMNSSAMGLALAGRRVIMLHVRMDFLASGMCALVNHIPIWSKKGIKLPIVFIVQVGKGMGQGPQHSKNLTQWFKKFEGWTVMVPSSPKTSYDMLTEAINGDKPVMYVVHRELFDCTEKQKVLSPEDVRLCGTSRRHETEFYGA